MHGLGKLVLAGGVFEFPAKSLDPVLGEHEAAEDGHDAFDAVLLEEQVGHVDGVHGELLDPLVDRLDESVLGWKFKEESTFGKFICTSLERGVIRLAGHIPIH